MRDKKKTEDELGRCYESAAFALLNLDPALVAAGSPADWVLVHGRPRLSRPPFVRFGHAWLENADVVFAAEQRVLVSKSLYYEIGQITDEDRFTYTFEEARANILKSGHWGPWEGLEAGGEE